MSKLPTRISTTVNVFIAGVVPLYIAIAFGSNFTVAKWLVFIGVGIILDIGLLSGYRVFLVDEGILVKRFFRSAVILYSDVKFIYERKGHFPQSITIRVNESCFGKEISFIPRIDSLYVAEFNNCEAYKLLQRQIEILNAKQSNGKSTTIDS